MIMAVHLILKFSLLLFLLKTVNCENEVPLLIWGTGINLLSEDPTALEKLSADQFYNNVLKKLVSYNPPTIAVFFEKSLSSEDFRWKDVNGESAYPYLKRIATDEVVKFYPYVNDTYSSFKALQNLNYRIAIYDKETEKLDDLEIKRELLPSDTNNIFLINLNDARIGEDRPDLLRQHDHYIRDICSDIREKYGNVLCALTAYGPSWIEPKSLVRKSRSLLATDNPTGQAPLNLYHSPKFAMIYTKSPPVLYDGANNLTFSLTIDPNSLVNMDKTKQQMSVQFIIQPNNEKEQVWLRFVFIVDSSTSWKMKEIILNKGTVTSSLITKSNIGTSKGSSFHTPVPVIFKSADSLFNLTFSNLQAQYLFDEDRSTFGVVDDTVYFFTIPILSGLFVSILLTTIVLFGLSMIFDIKTMDQFDDPKGKTVTINASD